MEEYREMVPMSEKIRELENNGYTKQFSVEEDGLVDLDTKKTYKPNEIKEAVAYRFEGTSNPADMSIVYALTTLDDVKGTLSNAYGTYADELTDDFIEAIPG